MHGVCKYYSWGKKLESSIIAKFLDSEHSEGENHDRIAEIWFGIHPNGTSKVNTLSTGEHKTGQSKVTMRSLKDCCSEGSLPFLAKILSVDNVLSIQIHPNSAQALELHKANPKEYPDTSSKPEMGIAISSVSLLCGFMSLEECWAVISRNEGFQALIRAGHLSALYKKKSFDSSDLFRRFILELLELPVSALECFANATFRSEVLSKHDALALRASEYLKQLDPGLVLLYLLEYQHVEPGEAIYIAPGVPHAYVSGELFECMKCSDNVVRGGLTSKFVDKEMFSKFFFEGKYDHRLQPNVITPGVRKYDQAELPFSIYSLTGEVLEHRFSSDGSEKIFLAVNGEGTIRSASSIVHFKAGDAFFLPPQCQEYSVYGSSLKAFQVSGFSPCTE